MPNAPAPAGATATTPTQGSSTPTANGKAPSTSPGQPPVGSRSGQPSAPKAKAEPSGKTGESTEDTWGDSDTADLLERFKRFSKHDQRARVKVKGEEKGIESLEDLYGVFHDAQRGRGAHKVVEEAKREAAEAKKVLELRQRAAQGDLEALHELAGPKALEGLEHLRQRTSEEQQLRQQMSEAERVLFDELQQTRRLLAQREALEAKTKAEREKAAQEQRLASVKSEAQERARGILEGLKLPPEKLGVIGPFMARAMREAAELGLELGKDVPAERLIESAKGEMRAVFSETLEGMAPDALLDFLEELKPGTQKALGTAIYRRLRPGQTAPQARGEAPQSKPADPDIGTPSYFFGRNVLK